MRYESSEVFKNNGIESKTPEEDICRNKGIHGSVKWNTREGKKVGFYKNKKHVLPVHWDSPKITFNQLI